MVINFFERVYEHVQVAECIMRACVAFIFVLTPRLLCTLALTCSGLSPGGTHAYSSEAQPESSSEMECLWKSDTSFVIIFSSWPGTERTACSSRTHLQCTQIFLRRQGQLWASSLGSFFFFFTDLQHKPKQIKCQILQEISQVGSPGASGTKVQTTVFKCEPDFRRLSGKAQIQRK